MQDPRPATRSVSSTLVRDTRGAQHVEHLIVVALVALGGVSGYRYFSGSVQSKAIEHGDRVVALEAGEGRGATPSAAGEPDAPVALDEDDAALLVLMTTLVTPGSPADLWNRSAPLRTASGLKSTWDTFVEGLDDTAVERRWGANGRGNGTAPKKAATAIMQATSGLLPTDDDLRKQGQDLLATVGGLKAQAENGSPSDGFKTGINKLSRLAGFFTDYRAYDSVTVWRDNARRTERAVADYLERVDQRQIRNAGVVDLYRDVLGRTTPPTSEEVSHHAKSGFSLPELRGNFVNTPEARAAVEKLYGEVLGRGSDAPGLDANVGALRQHNLADVRLAMARGPEAQGVIRQAFSAAGLSPTPADMTNWTTFLGNGGTVDKMRGLLAEKGGRKDPK